jgi:cobalt-zinc-cadmium efflux system membrane fusion protein
MLRFVTSFRPLPLAAAVLLLWGCSRPQTRQESADEVTVVAVAAEAVQQGRLRAVVHASGVVTASRDGEFLVVASEPARILDITRNEGDMVSAGDVLVRFDSPAATQEASRQRAEVARVQAQLENARVSQTRAHDLVARGLMPRVDQDLADREFADAQALLTRTQAASGAADAAVARATVRAPFAGVVAKRLHQPGDVAQATPADPVLRIVDPRRLEVTAFVPAVDRARVVPGATARLAGAPEDKVVLLTVGAQAAIEAVADGSVRVRLEFAQPTDLPVDTPVQVDIDAEERNNVLFINPDALVRNGSENVVFVAVGDRAQRRPVTTGIVDEQGVEITSGLTRGELVITRGQVGLADGAQISVSTGR